MPKIIHLIDKASGFS